MRARTRVRLLFAAAVVGGIFIVFWHARSTLSPFLVGLFFAYLLLPVIRWIEELMPAYGWWGRVRRPVAVVSTIFVAISALVAGLDELQKSVEQKSARLIESLPETWRSILAENEDFRNRYERFVPTSIREWIDGNIDEIGQTIVSSVQGGFESLFNLTTANLLDSGAMLVMVPLFVLFFLLEEPRWRSIIRNQVPRGWVEDAVSTLSIVDRTFGSYIRGVVIDAAIVGLLIGTAFWLVGVELAVALGVVAFFGEIVPIVGPWMAFLITAPVVFSTQPEKFLLASSIFLAVQAVNIFVLVPRIRGGSVDFTTAQAVILLAIGGSLFGSLGLIFVLPAAGMIRQVVVYTDSRLEGFSPDIASTVASQRFGSQSTSTVHG